VFNRVTQHFDGIGRTFQLARENLPVACVAN
jgi:hypothetical protein